ncbi:MAG: tRNA (adenosine(37)-N6)-threonylcarbamoyltransferase complex dimerization subunit type 1 TsaB [Armatimonadetes bacterium]|nr:tRNA (adenosine(37)-N6)-threonylcarbamoyltransferase complex dimerization subunit type 1 TsaB [Armatimonadota bacterium]
MILVVSTSSPLVSVALLNEEGVLAHREKIAPRQASPAVFEMLRELKFDPATADFFVADVGPGSFTGVRVGVTIAKTLAFAVGKQACGISAFKLITGERIAIPVRKNEYLLSTGETVSSLPPGISGYGEGFADQSYPLARNASLKDLKPLAPELLVPDYRLEPSISFPKQPYHS